MIYDNCEKKFARKVSKKVVRLYYLLIELRRLKLSVKDCGNDGMTTDGLSVRHEGIVGMIT
jgi:hypothetical protein